MISPQFLLAFVGTAFVAITIGASVVVAVAFVYIRNKNQDAAKQIRGAFGQWLQPVVLVVSATVQALSAIASVCLSAFFDLYESGMLVYVVPISMYSFTYLYAGSNHVFLEAASSLATSWFEIWLHTFDQLIWVVRIVYEAIIPVFNMVWFVITDTGQHVVSTVLSCTTLSDARMTLLEIGISPVMGLTELITSFVSMLGPAAQTGQHDSTDNLYVNSLQTDNVFEAAFTKPLTNLEMAFSCTCQSFQPAFQSALAVLIAPNAKRLFFHLMNIPVSWVQGMLQMTSAANGYKPNFRPLYTHVKGAGFEALVTGDVVLQQTMTAASNEVRYNRGMSQQQIEILDIGGPFTALAHVWASAVSVWLLPLGIIDLLWSDDTTPYEAFDIYAVFAHADIAASVFSANVGALSHMLATGHVPGADSGQSLLHCPVREFDYTKGLIKSYSIPTVCHCRYQPGFCGKAVNGHCAVDGQCECTNNAIHLVSGTNLSPCVQPCSADADCNSISLGNANMGECHQQRCSCKQNFVLSVLDGKCHPSGSTGTHDNLKTALQVQDLYTSRGCVGIQEPDVGYSVPCAALHAMRAPVTTAFAAYEFMRMQIFGVNMMLQHELKFSAVLERYIGASYPMSGLDSAGSCAQRKNTNSTFIDLNVDPNLCRCDLPTFAAATASNVEPGVYDPWCQLPTFSLALEQVRGAQVYAAQFLGLQDYLPGTRLAEGWQSAMQAAMAGNAPGFVTANEVIQEQLASERTGAVVALSAMGLAAARCALHAIPLLIDFFVELVAHGESEIMRPMNCETGFPPSLLLTSSTVGTVLYDSFDAAKAAMQSIASSSTCGVSPAACSGAKTWLHAQSNDPTNSKQLLRARQLATLYQTWHEDMSAFKQCTKYTAKSFKIGSVVCADNDALPSAGEDAQNCQCNPQAAVTAASTCRALSRLPIAQSVHEDLAHVDVGGFWNNFYGSLPSHNRWTRGLAAYEPYLYEMQNAAVMVERAIAALHFRPDTQCDDPTEIYSLTNVNLISTWYVKRDGKIQLRNALDGVTYHPESGLITGRKNSELNPCMPSDTPAEDAVCPIYGHYQLPCSLGAMLSQDREMSVREHRLVMADVIGVLGGDLQAISIDKVPMLCAMSRYWGFASSAIASIFVGGGAVNLRTTRQISRAFAQLLYSGFDYTFTSWLLITNIANTLASQLINDASSINDGTVLSWVLVGIDYSAAQGCEILLGLEEFFESLGAGGGFLRDVRAVIASVFQYVNAEILSFLVVPLRFVTSFFTFVFRGTPSFGEVVQDLLLIVGKIIQFVLHNVFKIFEVVMSLLPGIGPTIAQFVSIVCQGLFEFLHIIVEGINHIPFVHVKDPFDPRKNCVSEDDDARRLFADAEAGGDTAFRQLWTDYTNASLVPPGFWAGSSACAMMSNPELKFVTVEDPPDTSGERIAWLQCLRSRTVIAHLRNVLGMHDLPFWMLDSASDALLASFDLAHAAMLMMTAGNASAAAGLGLPVQTVGKVYAGMQNIAQRASQLWTPLAWSEELLPEIYHDEDVRDPRSNTTGAMLYRLLQGAHRLPEEFRRRSAIIEAHKPRAPANLTHMQNIMYGARRRLTEHASVPTHSVARPPAARPPARTALQPATSQCRSPYVCTNCEALDDLLNGFVSAYEYLHAYYVPAKGPFKTTIQEFVDAENLFIGKQLPKHTTTPELGNTNTDKNSVGTVSPLVHLVRKRSMLPAPVQNVERDRKLEEVSEVHEDPMRLFKAIEAFFSETDPEAKVPYFGSPAAYYLTWPVRRCDVRQVSKRCDMPLRDEFDSLALAALATYVLSKYVTLGIFLKFAAGTTVYMSLRYDYTPMCGPMLPPCLVRDLQALTAKTAPMCFCLEVAPDLVKGSCDPYKCAHEVHVGFHDCPVRHEPGYYFASQMRYYVPWANVLVFGWLPTSVQSFMGLDDMVKEIIADKPMAHIDKTCDVFLGFPVALLESIYMVPLVSVLSVLALQMFNMALALLLWATSTATFVSSVLDAFAAAKDTDAEKAQPYVATPGDSSAIGEVVQPAGRAELETAPSGAGAQLRRRHAALRRVDD